MSRGGHDVEQENDADQDSRPEANVEHPQLFVRSRRLFKRNRLRPALSGFGLTLGYGPLIELIVYVRLHLTLHARCAGGAFES